MADWLIKAIQRKIFSKVKLLKSLGLDVPFASQVKEKLLQSGISIPKEINSEKELINYLCQSNSKK